MHVLSILGLLLTALGAHAAPMLSLEGHSTALPLGEVAIYYRDLGTENTDPRSKTAVQVPVMSLTDSLGNHCRITTAIAREADFTLGELMVLLSTPTPRTLTVHCFGTGHDAGGIAVSSY